MPGLKPPNRLADGHIVYAKILTDFRPRMPTPSLRSVNGSVCYIQTALVTFGGIRKFFSIYPVSYSCAIAPQKHHQLAVTDGAPGNAES